jgi:hypothetical protein
VSEHLFNILLMQEFAIIIWPFKCQVSVVAAGLLILSVHVGHCFPVWKKRLYIHWDSFVQFIRLKG